MLLEIMENVRRVAVLRLKTTKVILSRVAVLESETAELISASGRGQVQNNQPGYFSLEFRGNVISGTGTESAIAHTLRSLEQITPTW